MSVNMILLMLVTNNPLAVVDPVIIAAAVGHSRAFTPTAANLVSGWNRDQSRRHNAFQLQIIMDVIGKHVFLLDLIDHFLCRYWTMST